jgi:hypothetical protein
MQDATAAVKAVEAAAKAYDYGRGAWPRANVADRISAMEKFIKGLQTMRKEIVNLLLYVSLPSGYYFFFFFFFQPSIALMSAPQVGDLQDAAGCRKRRHDALLPMLTSQVSIDLRKYLN